MRSRKEVWPLPLRGSEDFGAHIQTHSTGTPDLPGLGHISTTESAPSFHCLLPEHKKWPKVGALKNHIISQQIFQGHMPVAGKPKATDVTLTFCC